MRVSTVAGLADALLCYTSAASFYERGLGDPFRSLAERSWSARGFGDFWGHVLVAEGVADVMVEPEVNLWDLAPLLVIVEEAGGRLTDFGGVARADGGCVVTTNGLVHDEVLAVLASDGR